jgi:hypothetical protein
MECHRCVHREDMAAGKFRDVPFEKTPCSQCELVERSEHTIAFDEERGPGGIRLCQGSGGQGGQWASAFAKAPADRVGSGEGGDDRVPISVMSEAVAQLLTMPRTLRDIVCWRYAGMKYRDIAAVFGVTTKAIERRHQRALDAWPVWRALFAWKAAKRKRRKPHGGERWKNRRALKSSSVRSV